MPRWLLRTRRSPCWASTSLVLTGGLLFRRRCGVLSSSSCIKHIAFTPVGRSSGGSTRSNVHQRLGAVCVATRCFLRASVCCSAYLAHGVSQMRCLFEQGAVEIHKSGTGRATVVARSRSSARMATSHGMAYPRSGLPLSKRGSCRLALNGKADRPTRKSAPRATQPLAAKPDASASCCLGPLRALVVLAVTFLMLGL